ncbi:Cas8a1 family CRISPR/Cas system-associated protein [Methanococcus voltae]|uniref:CRISPR-associated protein CXXC-CXXC domain-containing protein n=1 Tax=Methanococcus voltae (strain ATCC BAA-1334 / A3) TaxID=456320 RepID=D7DSW3_METV3|nr:Cas8a1 family CRISPR/Cas system-associated protein [Methanococcus voltae]MCS3901887.1 CRISPR-associated protein Cst1 [Methanococcus voltae]
MSIFKMTGNPFVNHGIYCISGILDKEINEISIDDLYNVANDEFIYRCDSIKAYTMVFGMNGPLKQPSFKGDKRKFYKNYLISLIESINKDITKNTCKENNSNCNGNSNSNSNYNTNKKSVCMVCGEEYSEDITDIWINTQIKSGLEPQKNDKFEKFIGRELFPLIGSYGNDAQILPASSKAPHICPKCLFAVNFLPLSTMLMKGKLICLESNSTELARDLVNKLYNENTKGVNFEDDKREIPGKKEGNLFYKTLMQYFGELKEYRKNLDLKNIELYIWMYSNGGTSPDCEVYEIPNETLLFLKKISRRDFIDEFYTVIINDKSRQLFENIVNNQDYLYLYPYKKFNGVSIELYEFYQREVVKRSDLYLEIAKKIAKEFINNKDKKFIDKISKGDAFKERQNVVDLKKLVYEMILNGILTYDEYMEFFNNKGFYLKTNKYDDYLPITFYINKFKEGLNGGEISE